MTALRSRVEQLEAAVQNLEQRNARVESDKAWETSNSRTALVGVLTYLVTAIVFRLIGVQDFYLNAFIPTFAFVLSMLSFRWVKGWWLTKAG